MSYFSKSNVLLWVIIVLLIVVLSALGTMMHRMNKRIKGFRQTQDTSINNVMRIKEALNLNEEQTAKVKQIKLKQSEEQLRVRSEIFKKRQVFLDELTSDNPDTNKLNTMMPEIAKLQVQLKKQSVKQYLEIKRFCNPEQKKKLELLVRNKLWGIENKPMNRRNHFK